MAIINCPECKNNISDKATICVHCGYPLDEILSKNCLDNKESKTTVKNSPINTKYFYKKYFTIISIMLAVVTIVIAICIGNNIYKNQRVNQYRVEFNSEDEMRTFLRSGSWVQTSAGGGYTLSLYLTFEHSFCSMIDREGDFETIRTQYVLNYKDSIITSYSGSHMYDLIYYKGDYYLLQNPKTDPEDWILFRLYQS